MRKSIVYVRVSSLDQVTGTSLDTQEAACRAYCARKNLDVSQVFREEGESAKTADRPLLKEALKACRAGADVLVVWKLDRLARNQADFHALKAFLSTCNTALLSATERLTEDPTGRFLSGMLAAVAQLDNDVRAERTRSGMTARARAGWFVWSAPLGYRNKRTADGPSLEIDPDVAPFIREAFETFATGVSQADVRRLLVSRGVRGKGGAELSAQAVNKILRKPTYTALLQSSLTGPDPVEGKWPPIVSRHVWARAQARFGPPAAIEAPAEEVDFPLRGYVLCDRCGQPLTAGWSKGRSKRYAYYRCQHCTGTNVRKETIEELFCTELEKVKIPPEILAGWKNFLRQIWESQGLEITQRANGSNQATDQLRKQRDRLVDVYTAGTIPEEVFTKKAKELERKFLFAKAQETNSDIEYFDFHAAIDYAVKMLSNPVEFWRELPTHQKHLLGGSIFAQKPTWDGSRILNHHKNGALNDLRQIESPEKMLVALAGFVLNQHFVFLAGLDALRRAA